MAAQVRKGSAGLFWLVTIVATTGITLGNLLLFSRQDSPIWVLHRATDGWINANLPLFLLLNLLVIGGLTLDLGRLTWADIGLRQRWPLRLALWLAGGWIAVQMLAAAAALASSGGIALHPAWSEHGAGTVVGLLIAMVIGTAFFEDVVFRGFLVPQCALHLEGRIPSAQARTWAAWLLVAAIFALWHLPTILLNPGHGSVAGALAYMMLGGLMLGLLYLRTGDLALAIAAHALVNAPTLLVATPVSGSALAGFLGVAAIALGPKLAGQAWSATGLLTFEEREAA